MAYYKGQGGRPKGAKNKSTDLHAKCKNKDLDVFDRLLELAVLERGTSKEWSRLSELATYLYAKPKDTGEAEITPDQIREWIREQNAKPTGT